MQSCMAQQKTVMIKDQRCLKNRAAREMAQQPRESTVLQENLSSVPNTHVPTGAIPSPRV